MQDAVQQRIRSTEERHRVLRERGYDVAAMRMRLVECARPVGGRILDVGTGPGRLAILLAREGRAEVATLEFEGEGIEVARQNAREAGVIGRLRFLRGDAARLPCPDGSFDLVASANLIHHMEDPVRAVREMVRVCGAGGRVVLGDLNARGLALLTEVHAMFGGTHEAGPKTIDEAVGSLPGEGLSVERWEEGFQVLYRIQRIA